ncbi:hypothetical protein EVJ58_g4239 [Rhodofomes roseus]|uniref:Uncharacterized protein n=1 Tax=Rhodofomes roseus TaxID=34475 RepID=A0A4Y9YJ88_9APHY|nr:hypothetical protein EVJ58_g4239 [Rhodofomes roseus]
MSTSSRSLSPPPASLAGPSARGRSQSRKPVSRSRPGSPLTQAAQLQPPQRPPLMARPSSRSERLLRDTLRRAEEHDRMLTVNPLPSPKLSGVSLPGSPFLAPTGTMLLNGSPPVSAHGSRRHSRKNTASSVASISCDLCDLHFDSIGASVAEQDADDEEDEAQRWSVHTGTSASSSSSGHGHVHTYFQAAPTPPGLTRTRSITQSSRAGAGDRAHSDSVAQVAYGTPSSPSPARAHLQRSAPSAPHVGRAAQAQRTSPERAPAVTPHDAVLRNKLEGVLRGAKEQGRREKSTERRYRADPGSSSGSGNSMASSRNLSAESDLFFGANGEVSTRPVVCRLKRRVLMIARYSVECHVALIGGVEDEPDGYRA